MRSQPSYRPLVEPLEHRELLTTGLQAYVTGGNLYVVSASNGRVFSFDGSTGAQIGAATNTDGSGFFLTSPFGVAIQPSSGNLYVSDTSDNTIRIFRSARPRKPAP